MSNKEETPISKYLAGLERRQALLTPSPAPDAAAIIRKINFDDTFFQGDQGAQNVSPSPLMSAPRHPPKRKRLSILGESLEDEENQDKKISELERLLQKTQGELIEARAMNIKLEHQISKIKSANGERILGFETSANQLKMKMRESNDQVVLLKEQVTKLTKKEEELQETLHKQTELHCEKVKSLEDRLRESERSNVDLRGKFGDESFRKTEELKKLNASLEETEMGAEKWVMETQLLRDQLELKDKQLKKYQTELMEAQAIVCKYEELKAKYDYPRTEGESTEDLEQKVKRLENQYVKQQSENIKLLDRIEVLTDENRMLRSSMDREMLLEEQISAFEEEVRALRGILEEKAALEVETVTLKSDLQGWRKIAFKLDPDCTHPHKFEFYIRKIQNQLLEAKHESSTLQHTINDRDRSISKIQAEVGGLHAQVKSLTAEKERLSLELKKTTRRLTLITKDRDGLKDLKESYEQEFEGVISKPLQDRINQLEATVAEYEALIQDDPSMKKSCGDCEKRQALVNEIRAELERLKSEKAQVETQLADVNKTMGASMDDGNTTGVKIVSFGVNPSAMPLEARLKEAIKENGELKEKIKELQERTGTDMSSMDAGENLRDLEERNTSLERRLAILSEAYDFETQQLQLIVNKLCGFHFTLVREPTVQIRLSSVYSHQRDDTFIFQESPNGDMLLLESPILDSFRDDIERFLIRDGSIPGFLSYVTITYLQSQNTQDASQLPASQQSVAEDETTSNVPRNPREIQVEVTRQRHPTGTDADYQDDEDVDEDDDDEEERNDDEVDEDDDHDDDGMDGDELEEEDEHYEDDEEEHYEDDEEDDSEPSPPQPQRRGHQLMRAPPAPPVNDDSDDDVIMIDDD